jgi:peptide chain release factor 2
LIACGGIFDHAGTVKRLLELDELAADPALWQQPEQAEKLLKERRSLERKRDELQGLRQELEDCTALWELAEEAGDGALLAELETTVAAYSVKLNRHALASLMRGEADGNDCFLSINAGAGGTESQDWVAMLLRLYLRWAERRGYSTELLEESAGEEAGLKSVSLRINGDHAYGWLKGETGVHRLVRISPFDSNARRHTSFAAVNVAPVVDEAVPLEILDKDLRIDTFRASGAGGQHVNKTDSAIRITHLPTNIVVACQTERSQHRNRALAFDMLRARIYEIELRKREAANQNTYDNQSDIGWGHQIRSYVLQPYQMIKDMRTGVEVGNAGAVLDGDIDPFLESYLQQQGEKAVASSG